MVKLDPDMFWRDSGRLFQSFVFSGGCLYGALEAIESFEANMTGIWIQSSVIHPRIYFPSSFGKLFRVGALASVKLAAASLSSATLWHYCKTLLCCSLLKNVVSFWFYYLCQLRSAGGKVDAWGHEQVKMLEWSFIKGCQWKRKSEMERDVKTYGIDQTQLPTWKHQHASSCTDFIHISFL